MGHSTLFGKVEQNGEQFAAGLVTLTALAGLTNDSVFAVKQTWRDGDMWRRAGRSEVLLWLGAAATWRADFVHGGDKLGVAVPGCKRHAGLGGGRGARISVSKG